MLESGGESYVSVLQFCSALFDRLPPPLHLPSVASEANQKGFEKTVNNLTSKHMDALGKSVKQV